MIRFEDVMKKFDKENKGYLDHDEFHALVKSVGAKVTAAQVSDCIAEIDADGDGSLDYNELQKGMSSS